MTNPWNQFQQDFCNKRVLILGLGLQGRGLSYTKLLAEIGAKLSISDLKSETQLAASLRQLNNVPHKLLLGGHQGVNVSDYDVIFRNPSVPVAHPLLVAARQLRIPIKMDTSLYFKYAQPKNAIGITGTRGKSTTTALIQHGLLAAGRKAIKCGNIAPESMLTLLQTPPTQDTFLVTELSSWQLQGFHDEGISPHLSVITNIYEDHLLDRSFLEYQQDKSAIFAYQSQDDWLVTNAANPIAVTMATSAASQVVLFDTKSHIKSMLPGQHNQENLAAATEVLKILGINQPELSQFSGLPFRQQLVAQIDGVKYINDTTSTTPIAAIKALATYPDSIMIVGGSTKHLPVNDLIQSLNENAAKIVLLTGSGTDEIKIQLDQAKIVGEFSRLDLALNAAKKVAVEGQFVVFSPGFTSFGLFENEFDRGRQFNQAVESIK